MASLFDRITTRLARVQPPFPLAETLASDPPSAAISAAPAEPMTLESLEAALDRLALARSEQMAIIYGADAERDRIMDDPDGDDNELLAIQNRVTLAQLTVDRIARLEDEAVEQLQPLREARQRAAWEAARNQFCRYARDYHAAMESLERAANQLWAVRQAVFAPLGLRGWEEQVPRLPRLMIQTTAGAVPMDSALFAQDVDRFSRINVGGPPPVESLGNRLSSFIHGRIEAASIERTAIWGLSSSVAEMEVLVRLTRDATVQDEVLRRGATVRVTAAHARELIAANRAVLSNPIPERGVGGAVRTLPVSRNAFIQEPQEK